MILAPAIMAAEKSPKNAAAKCLESVGLDSDMYRIGHTKARKLYLKKKNSFNYNKFKNRNYPVEVLYSCFFGNCTPWCCTLCTFHCV